MIPVVGDVLFDNNFTFNDGRKGEKWFIILANVGDDTNNVYVARVTSQQKSPLVQDCYPSEFNPVYFLKAGVIFKKNTWVQFDQVLIFDFERASEIKKKSWTKKLLSMKTTYKLLICAAKSIHIDGYTEDALLRQAEIFK